ncbi:MAG: M14 family zinc carboxypeptidase [Balneolaceae bacterium]
MIRSSAVTITLFLFSLTTLSAQPALEEYLPAGVSFNPDIPTPQSVIRHEVGEWHVTHDRLISYFTVLAEYSERVSVEEYATTYEGRPLLLLTITSRQNHSNIDRIKENQRLLTDPRQSANLDITGMPVIVNLSYSIHGNEPSGANASMIVAYYLAAAEGDDIERLLQESVILIDPSLNPDGLHRFSTWVNMHKNQTAVTDPNSREFHESWPGGRTNHYWFDLNRDWLSVQHPSSRGRVAKFHEWKPNVLADFHEMGTDNSYFFQPGVPERTHPLTPPENQQLTMAIAGYHADALEERQELYFTGERYDDFFYGKGSTYPDVQGAVGILFEQSSSRGHEQESVYGVKRFQDTILNQVTTSLSTIRASRELKEELQESMRSFYRQSLLESQASDIQGYLFGDRFDRSKSWHLAEMISRHDIEVYDLAEDLDLNGTLYRAGQAYVIPVEQPQYRLLTSLFEQRTAFEDSLFYDVSAWTLPLAFNIPYEELSADNFQESTLLGDRVRLPDRPQGEVVGGRSSYSYLFEWDDYYAPRALYRLQNAGVRTLVASEPFRTMTAAGIRDFQYGAIQIPLGIQDDVSEQEVYQLLAESTREDGVTVYAAQSGLNPRGIDLGSPGFINLRMPKAALIVGSGVNESEAGEVWHLLDYRFRVPVTMLEKSQVSTSVLNRYNVLIMVSGGYGDLSESDVEQLKQWVRGGGTLIALGSAVQWANSVGLANLEFASREISTPEFPQRYADLDRMRGMQQVGGAIFHGRVDTTHPIGYGYRNEEISLFRNSTTVVDTNGSNPFAVPVSYHEDPLASGYISDENLEALRGSASVIISSFGNGRTIAMADNPNFRAFWFGTNKLFLNALFFGDTINRFSTN